MKSGMLVCRVLAAHALPLSTVPNSGIETQASIGWWAGGWGGGGGQEGSGSCYYKLGKYPQDPPPPGAASADQKIQPLSALPPSPFK
jgi:hypothetical protein